MCGIAGIVSVTDFDPGSLQRMSAALAHRGPDGEGFLITDLDAPLEMTRCPAGIPARRPVVAFAHRRLSIIDLSAANDQPLVDGPGELAIAFNGEIYNYRELRAELQSLGHRFRTSGDTEVALLAYAQWGADCVKRFVGMWSFAICDRPRRQLVLSRDRFGIKPLFWTTTPGRLLFASELKGLFASGLVAARPDEPTVARYLTGGRVDVGDQTFFAHIQRLPAATTAVVSLGERTLEPRMGRYWSLPEAAADRASPNGLGAATRSIRTAFEDSMRLHLRSDVPVGTCLSGGIDSSGIVGVADLLRGELDSTYTHKAFGYIPPERGLSERPYMEAVAQRCGMALIFAEPTTTEFHQALGEVMAAQDEPFGSASIAAQWFVFAAASRAGVKVMLDGQGADEVFGGYHHYLRLIAQDLLIRRRARELQRFMRDAAVAVGKPPYPRWFPLGVALPTPVARHARNTLMARAQARAPVSDRLRRLAPDAAVDPLAGLDADAILRADVESYNLPALLRYEDRNSMAHSIEARVPYLDHRLVEDAFSLPASMRMAGAQPKRILRDALRDAVPEVVLARRDKVAFRASPSATWSLARSMRRELLAPGGGAAADWIAPEAMRRLLDRPNPTAEDEFALWRVVNAKLWARQRWG